MPNYIVASFVLFLIGFVFFYLTSYRLKNKEKIYSRMHAEIKKNSLPKWFIHYYFWVFVVFYIASGILIVINAVFLLFWF